MYYPASTVPRRLCSPSKVCDENSRGILASCFAPPIPPTRNRDCRQHHVQKTWWTRIKRSASPNAADIVRSNDYANSRDRASPLGRQARPAKLGV